MTEYKSLVTHIGKVSDAFFSRLMQPDAPYLRWVLVYHESAPGMRGGMAVISADDSLPPEWKPVGGTQADFVNTAMAMTRDQIFHRMLDAARRLPILDPNEE